MNPLRLALRRAAIGRGDEAGQVLAIVAGGLIVLVAMVGLIIDGGHGWGRQRQTQNGADSASQAGAVVILEWLTGQDKTAGDVGCAVKRAADEASVSIDTAQFTDHDGNQLAAVPECNGPDASGAIPSTAQGVRAVASQQFETFFMSVMGFDQMTARAKATAVVGPLSLTGAALPVTFPQTLGVCDEESDTYTIRDWDESNDSEGPPARAGEWDPYEILPLNAELDADNLAIVPLCRDRDRPGSVGWLDFGCAPNLDKTISEECNVFFTIPDWIQTHTGRIDSLEDELAAYHGDRPGEYEPEDSTDPDADHKIQMPIHNTTCNSDAGVSDTDSDGFADTLNPCPEGDWTGQGSPLHYGVEFWVGFILDEAHVQGGDEECEFPDGSPLLVNPGGDVGCLKGWFVQRIGHPDEVSIGDVNRGDPVDLGVTLIN